LVPQVVELGLRELEHEVLGKTPEIPLHGADESLRFDAVEGREIGVEHHLLATQENDGAGDSVGEDEGGLGHFPQLFAQVDALVELVERHQEQTAISAIHFAYATS